MDKSAFLKSKAARLLTAVLIIQAALLYGFSRKEPTPAHVPLAGLEKAQGDWQLLNEPEVDKEILEQLRADDTLSRTYINPSKNVSAHLWVAFFNTQRTGQAPHSPKNCLPGTGWAVSSAGFRSIDLPGRVPIQVNRYVVAKGDTKSLVMYWYQSRDRVVASEYAAKFYVVADAMRYNRTDTALVRVTVPIARGDLDSAEAVAVDFIRTWFVPLRAHFPG